MYRITNGRLRKALSLSLSLLMPSVRNIFIGMFGRFGARFFPFSFALFFIFGNSIRVRHVFGVHRIIHDHNLNAKFRIYALIYFRRFWPEAICFRVIVRIYCWLLRRCCCFSVLLERGRIFLFAIRSIHNKQKLNTR